MVFALLISAILWNLGTWWLGLPASSSHTLIGSIIGVGLANQFMCRQVGNHRRRLGQVGTVFRALLFSPVVGFVFSALLLLLFKAIIKDRGSTRRRRATRRRRSGFAACWSSPAPASASLTARTTAKRAWDSSC